MAPGSRALPPAPPPHAAPQALSKNGWLYDSTLIELYANWSATSPSADQMLWPYTMDSGIPQVGHWGLARVAPGCQALHKGCWHTLGHAAPGFPCPACYARGRVAAGSQPCTAATAALPLLLSDCASNAPPPAHTGRLQTLAECSGSHLLQDCQFMGVDVGKCQPGEKHPGLWEVRRAIFAADSLQAWLHAAALG